MRRPPLGAIGIVVGVVLVVAGTAMSRAERPDPSPSPRAAEVASPDVDPVPQPPAPPPASPTAPAEPTAPESPPATPDPPGFVPPTLAPPPQAPDAGTFLAVEGEPVDLVALSPHLQAFTGLSSWIDVYDTDRTPLEQVAAAAAAGVQTLFVQSSKWDLPDDIHEPARLAATIEGAHDAGMAVVTWYVPDFVDPAVDLRRSQAAVAFTTPRGDTADGFGIDIELEEVPDVALRSSRLLYLASALRTWAGPTYPIAAIVLPPLQLDLRASWWPGFPYAGLRPHVDVFVPMSYSSFRGTSAEVTYRWNLDNITELRTRAGDPDLLVHMAGGIADNLPEVGAFVDAARDGRVVGGGLYDLETTPPEAWAHLRRLRAPR